MDTHSEAYEISWRLIKTLGTSMHKMETCLMCMDLLDQFKKTACMSCQSLSSRAWALIMESKMKKKESVKVGGMCMAREGNQLPLNWKENPIKIRPILGIIKADFWLLIKGVFLEPRGFEEPTAARRKKKQGRNRKELNKRQPLELISMIGFINSFIPNSIMLG